MPFRRGVGSSPQRCQRRSPRGVRPRWQGRWESGPGPHPPGRPPLQKKGVDGIPFSAATDHADVSGAGLQCPGQHRPVMEMPPGDDDHVIVRVQGDVPKAFIKTLQHVNSPGVGKAIPARILSPVITHQNSEPPEAAASFRKPPC